MPGVAVGPAPSRRGGSALRSVALGLAIAATVGCSDDDDEDGTPSDDQVPTSPGEPDTDGDDASGLLVAGLGGRSADEVSSPWLVSTYLFRNPSYEPPSAEMTVGLLRYEDVTVADHVDFYANELDTCERTRDADGGGDTSPPPRISGGPTVTLNAPSGPWLVLERQERDDGPGVDYRYPFGEPVDALPIGTTLSIPGDVFPNVAAYPIAEPEAPIRLLPDENAVLDADTVYSWMPGDGSGHVIIQFIAFDPDSGDFIDFPLFCQAVDDGSFELSDEAREFVATAADDLVVRYERAREVVEIVDGIVFRTYTAVAE